MSRSSPRDGERDPGPGARRDRGASQADVPRPPLAFGSKPEVLVVCGPTGSGKSRLAVEVALRIGGEIVGCDALQVYRGFDAATGKPPARDRARVRHWLIDVADPRRDYSLAEYVRDADAAIADILSREAVPVVVGGTGMYLRGLLKGIVEAAPRDEPLRARLNGLAARFGAARLHRWLRSLDAESAARVRPEDAQRIVRALELAVPSGDNWSERLLRSGTWALPEERYRALKFGLDLERERLADRLARRVDAFFAAGLVGEVVRLLDEGVPPAANAFKGIGYREVLKARSDGRDPAATREAIVVATRQYAKRQRTWFRKEPGVTWLDGALPADALASKIASAWTEFTGTGGVSAPC